MASFTLLDLLAFAWFLGAWLGYSLLIEKTAKGRSGLNAMMNLYRDEWMERLLAREMRMVDAQVTAALQNGTAFFASTSLIAIGGTLTLLRSTEQILTVVAALPFGVAPSPELWEVEDDGARHHLRLCLLQIRLVVPAVQLFRHHGRRGAAAGGKGQRGGAGLRASRRAAVRRRRPPFQPRPARLLLCARLSRLVPRSACAGAHHHRHRDRDVAPAIRVGCAPGVFANAAARRRTRPDERRPCSNPPRPSATRT